MRPDLFTRLREAIAHVPCGNSPMMAVDHPIDAATGRAILEQLCSQDGLSISMHAGIDQNSVRVRPSMPTGFSIVRCRLSPCGSHMEVGKRASQKDFTFSEILDHTFFMRHEYSAEEDEVVHAYPLVMLFRELLKLEAKKGTSTSEDAVEESSSSEDDKSDEAFTKKRSDDAGATEEAEVAATTSQPVQEEEPQKTDADLLVDDDGFPLEMECHLCIIVQPVNNFKHAECGYSKKKYERYRKIALPTVPRTVCRSCAGMMQSIEAVAEIPEACHYPACYKAHHAMLGVTKAHLDACAPECTQHAQKLRRRAAEIENDMLMISTPLESFELPKKNKKSKL